MAETAILIGKSILFDFILKHWDKILGCLFLIIYVIYGMGEVAKFEGADKVQEYVERRSIPDIDKKIIGSTYMSPINYKDEYIYPLEQGCGTVTQHFGVTNFNPFHNGVDIAQIGGCKILATADGIVGNAGWSNDGCGYGVYIYHQKGVNSRYCHGNGENYVKINQVVKKVS